MKLKIKITKDVLERSKMCGTTGKYCMPTNCAISLAVRELFPKAYVETYDMWFDIKDVGNAMAPTARLPRIASDFITKFDSRTPEARVRMSPIEFEIDVPDSVIDRINIDEVKKLLENHPTLELTA